MSLFESDNYSHASPFLKWAGGKSQLIYQLNPFFEGLLNNKEKKKWIYVETFLGGGAVFFHLINKWKFRFKRIILNDLNTDLIHTYLCVKNNLHDVSILLEKLHNEYHQKTLEDKVKMYEDIKSSYNSNVKYDIERASYFVFLNKTGFNGMYRVNSKGEFNIPFSKNHSASIFMPKVLKMASEALQEADLYNISFEDIKLEKDMIVYLDPPYKPISPTSSFNSYQYKFDDDDQLKVKKFCDDINKIGSWFIQSNSDPTTIDENNTFFDNLYKDYYISRVEARRMIKSKGNKRGKIKELVITNYNIR